MNHQQAVAAELETRGVTDNTEWLAQSQRADHLADDLVAFCRWLAKALQPRRAVAGKHA